jgi:hypothetical protein
MVRWQWLPNISEENIKRVDKEKMEKKGKEYEK